jgi:Cu(I)/Ag(I) efflux system membrane protein CusA/SilA
MKIVIPITLLLIFLLLYLNFKRITESLVVMLSVPFALVGGIWFLWLLDYNLSVAVAVGFIALAGVAAETGVVMLIYLEHAWQEKLAECSKRPLPNPQLTPSPPGRGHGVREGEGANVSRLVSREDLHDAIMHGAVERVRPKMMTVVAIMAGLLPILWSSGTGSEVMRRIAAPMVGGMISSAVLTLLVIPVIYALIKQHETSPTPNQTRKETP